METEANTNAKLAAALARAGFCIFPTRPADSGPGPDAPKAKTPLGVRGWRMASTNDSGMVQNMWLEFPLAMPAIDLAKSGLIVIDVDNREGGRESWRALMTENEFDPESTLMVETPNEGLHLYFRQKPGDRLGNKTGTLPAGIDVRGAGGYVIAPGAMRLDGRAYIAHGELNRIETIPDWLHAIVTTERQRQEPNPVHPAASVPIAVQSPNGTPAHVTAYIDQIFATLAQAGKGRRNNQLNDAAFSVAQVCAGHGLDDSPYIAQLQNAAAVLGLGRAEANATINSGLRGGRGAPRVLDGNGGFEDQTPQPLYITINGVTRNRETGEILDSDSAENTPKTIVSDPTRPPGLVGRIADWICAGAMRQQPAMAAAAALAIVGTAAGRQYRGPTGTSTHLYILALAATGSGKDHPNACIDKVLRAGRVGQHIGPSEFISMPALVKFLVRKPLSLCVMDEFGGVLERITSRRASSFETSLPKVLRTLWSKNFEAYVTPEWANIPAADICAPCISIYGAATPESFYKACTGTAIEDGTLNRFLLIRGDDKPESVEPAVDRNLVPDSIKSDLDTIYQSAGDYGGSWRNVSTTDPAVNGCIIDVPFCPDGAKEYWDKIRSETDKLIETAGAMKELYSRTAEMAIRIATIVAIGRMDDNQVRLTDLEWGYQLARQSADAMVDGAADYIAETDSQASAQLVRRLFKAAGGTLTQSELYKKVKNRIRGRELRDLVADMLIAGTITEVTEAAGNSKGRPATIYKLLH